MKKPIADTLREFASAFDRSFDELLTGADVPVELLDAVRYSALAPGKRIRPWLAVRCCEMVGGNSKAAIRPAAAIECIHAFSLVHDDLPALDNDDLRRGRPTTHRQCGEAMAILAGDALVMLAFELLASCDIDPSFSQAMTLELARGAGWAGMIGGQAADITGTKTAPAECLARYIHDRKTARLFTAACRIGALAAPGDQPDIDSLGTYGMHLGRAFQIADDLLDLNSNAATLGKAARKDAQAGKQTYPASVGVEASRAKLEHEVTAAIRAVSRFGPKADDLAEMARYAGYRNY